MAIYITGDTHAEIDIHKISNKALKPLGISLTDKDYLIITGDFGFPFYPSDISEYENNQKSEYTYWINWLKNKPYTILFVDGNHDNHDFWKKQSITEMFNGLVQIHPHANNIIHLMRGQVYIIEDHTFFTMGGAKSTDIYNRTEHKSWWKEELPCQKEYEIAINNLEKYNFNVDYVVTHTCATSYLQDLYGYETRSDELTSFFNHLEFDFKLNFKHWYFGHHHKDRGIDSKHTCLYYDVVKIF